LDNYKKNHKHLFFITILLWWTTFGWWREGL